MKTAVLGFLLAAVIVLRIRLRRRPFEAERYPRMRDIHGTVHFARSLADSFGWVACGYHQRHLAEEIGGFALIGERLDGTLCRECLQVIAPVSDIDTYLALPDERKRQLCVELMAEFDIDFAETSKGELRHQCTLPFGGHTDRNSVTASINYKKLLFNCFVCQNSGSVLWWAAVNRKETVTATRDWIRDAAGFTSGIPLTDLMAIIDSLFHPRSEQRIITTYSPRLLDPWTGWRMHHPYLTLPWAEMGREIPPDTLTKFRVGYCDADDNWHYYQRIIIPVFWGDKLIGWQARRLNPEDPDPVKYKSSPDIPRDRILFASPQTLERTDLAVLVESPMSVLRHDHHLPVVATMGADVTDLQLKLLHRYRRIVLAFDNDKAGWDAVAGFPRKRRREPVPGLIERLRPYSEVFVARNPYGAIEGRAGVPDPSDFTDKEFAAQVAAAVPGVLWQRPSSTTLGVYARSD